MEARYTPPIEFYRAEAPARFPWVNIALFVLTCLTTLLVGAVQMEGFTNGAGAVETLQAIARSPLTMLKGWPFSLTLMTILFSHEMGHYLMCRYYGMDASLPYFIPGPSLVGTFGAFIKIRSPFTHRPALLEMGIAGPIAGFVMSIPALIVGIALSRFGSVAPGMDQLGEPLILKLIVYLLGKTPPAGMDTFLHPVALAAWFGFFVTGMNLIPAGQLDGGHVAYALFGRGHSGISMALMTGLALMGLFLWPGWLVWLAFLLVIGFRVGFSHPPTLDDSIPLPRRDIWLGWIGLAMFILCFTPVPFSLS
ncbi:MAG TPA: site-2 protease family protein [Terriglobia bacterium]|nr:site-2 protease family protein [Terriglobia bacterium]